MGNNSRKYKSVKMKFYFPESLGQIDTVGYNHAIKLFQSAFSEYITTKPAEADYRMYCNLPWYHNPKELKQGLPLFVYTMYESTKIPSAWKKFLNDHADIIAVPSEWCKKIFIANGIKKPIAVLSLCVDEKEVACAIKNNSSSKYNFLWQGVAYDPHGRKGVDLAVKAFKELKLEGKIPEANLILKYRPNENITINVNAGNGIRFLQKDMSRSELVELYKTVDCCVNPTRGEGFGLIPLEQMAMGKPVLVTDFSISYINPDYCIPLKYKLEDSSVFWNHKYVAINKGAVSYNNGGVSKGFRFLPNLLNVLPDGVKTKSLPERKITGCKKLKARINNFFRSLQIKTRFYYVSNSKSYKFFQENTGKDATVDIEDLKTKMLWCYENREMALQIGIRARKYALENWSFERMISDFNNNVLPILKQRSFK